MLPPPTWFWVVSVPGLSSRRVRGRTVGTNERPGELLNHFRRRTAAEISVIRSPDREGLDEGERRVHQRFVVHLLERVHLALRRVDLVLWGTFGLQFLDGGRKTACP